MSGDTTGKTSKTEHSLGKGEVGASNPPTRRLATDWRRLRGMVDEEVHAAILEDPEIKPTDEAFWKEAHVVMPQRKQTVTMRLDADLLAWFRRQRGYQTRINAILRAYMNAHTDDR